ncbi:MAG: DegT/DnrJ/EryC1/StrS family aminotransferase [Clostridia bacterium]
MKRFEKRVYLASPYIHEEEREYVREAFDTNWMSTVGKNINELETCVCQYLGCGAAAALSSGTAALHLAIKLVGVQEGDVVLCSDMTFAATVNPVCYERGTPVFIDAERETWNMDPQALEAALKKYRGKTKAVVAANLYGTPAKLDEIADLCERYKVPLIEDAAESLSATYKGKQTGTYGTYNVISFNGNKIITGTSGGMLVSDDAKAIDKVKFWSNQARDFAPWYQHSELGYNYRMSNLNAGVARGQMLHLDEHRAGKKKIYERYKAAFENLPVEMNPYPACSEPNFWLSCFTIDKQLVESGKVTPEEIRLKLEEYNIESRPIWKPMHMQPFYAGCDYVTVGDKNGDVGEDIFTRGLCLPSDLNMSEEVQEVVCGIAKECFENETSAKAV